MVDIVDFQSHPVGSFWVGNCTDTTVYDDSETKGKSVLVSNWLSVWCLKCVHFSNWFWLHFKILDQLQTDLGRATHYVSTVTEQTV